MLRSRFPTSFRVIVIRLFLNNHFIPPFASERLPEWTAPSCWSNGSEPEDPPLLMIQRLTGRPLFTVSTREPQNLTRSSGNLHETSASHSLRCPDVKTIRLIEGESLVAVPIHDSSNHVQTGRVEFGQCLFRVRRQVHLSLIHI